jgi:hypothetical protein
MGEKNQIRGAALRACWPLPVLTLPGCTFYSWGNTVTPRPAAELQDVSPAVYVVIAVFCLILVAAVGAVLFKDEKQPEQFRDGAGRAFATVLAVFAGLVVLLLVG